MAGALVAITALPASTTIVSSDVVPGVIGATTKKITAGNLRAQMFAFAATDPLNCGILTAVGNSTITGALGGITTLTATTGTFTNLTVPTAAQPNVTSLGTLTGLQIGTVLSATLGVFRSSAGSVGIFQSNGVADGGNILAISHGAALTGTAYALSANVNTTVNGFISLSQSGTGVAAFTASALSTGDAVTQYSVPAQIWSVGCDQSDAKKFKISQLQNLGSGADMLSMTTAGVVTVPNGFTQVQVTGGASVAGSVWKSATQGLVVQGVTGSGNDLFLATPSAGAVLSVPTGTTNMVFAGGVTGITTLAIGGALTGVTALTMSGQLNMSAAASLIVPGATSVSFRNNANNADNLLIVDGGTATFRGAVSVGGNITMAAAAAKILRGATSLSIRDAADTSDLMLFNASGITLTNSLITAASVTGGSGFRLPSGTAPTSPVDGDMWYDGSNYKGRVGGVTKTFTVT